MEISASRLQRARHQYENLLIHAGEIVQDDSSPTKPGSNGTMLSSYVQQSSMTSNPRFDSSPSKSSGQIYPYRKQSEESGIIISLQEEIDRLRSKLESVIGTAEATYEEAQRDQEEVQNNFVDREDKLVRKVSALELENSNLKAALETTRAELMLERKQLAKSIRLIDRLKARGKEISSASSAAAMRRKLTVASLSAQGLAQGPYAQPPHGIGDGAIERPSSSGGAGGGLVGYYSDSGLGLRSHRGGPSIATGSVGAAGYGSPSVGPRSRQRRSKSNSGFD